MKECGSFIVEEELKIPSQTPLLHLGQGKGLNEAAGYISSPADTDKRILASCFFFVIIILPLFLVCESNSGHSRKGQAQWEHRIRASG